MRLDPLLAAGVILIAGGRSVQADPAPATGPATAPAGVRISIDTARAPDLTAWATDTLVPVLRAWYPRISAELPVPGHVPADHFSVVFDPDYKGVAATSGTHVVANPAWFRTQLRGEAVGALLHEEVHVIQRPGHALGGHHMPTWLLEGSADYIRWFEFEPAAARPHPRADHARYDASYRTTAAFLAWVTAHYDRHLVAELNAANYAGTYADDLWVRYTGRTAADLGAEWKRGLAP